MSNLEELVARARYCRDHGSFDSLHGELLDQIESLAHELEAERDRATQHFDKRMEDPDLSVSGRIVTAMSASGDGHSGFDNFNRASGATDWTTVQGTLPTGAWWSAPKQGDVSAQCNTCGHIITMQPGDDPIPYGDPRLCEHMGGPRSPVGDEDDD